MECRSALLDQDRAAACLPAKGGEHAFGVTVGVLTLGDE